MHPDIYHKPDYLRDELIRLMGEGVLVTEGPQHRNQRRLMNPAFGPGTSSHYDDCLRSLLSVCTLTGQVRDLTGIFLDKANEVSVNCNTRPSELTQFHFSAKREVELQNRIR
jgi:hypothetical protein